MRLGAGGPGMRGKGPATRALVLLCPVMGLGRTQETGEVDEGIIAIN
jgi:hypothetical protein